MRMNDYEYDLMMDSRDKKITARSARNARTHNGKRGAVKFPSDYLTKKEIKAMSGECVKYASLKQAMSWEDFKVLPDDLKKEYIASIREKFGAPDCYIAEMLGVSSRTLNLTLADLKCNAGKDSGNGRRKWAKEEFLAWRSGANLETEIAPVEETVEETSEPEIPETNVDSSSMSDNESFGCTIEKVRSIPEYGKLLFNCPADQALNTLAMILTGKNVRLSVEWDVLADED